MKLHVIPESDSPFVYATLATIPSTGVLLAMMIYEWLPNLKPLADASLQASWYMLAYASAAIGWKLLRLRFLRKRELFRSRLKVTAKAVVSNILVLFAVAIMQMGHS